MSSYITVKDKTVNYIIPVGAMNAFLNITDIAKEAINRDRNVLNRKPEEGPNFAIEVLRAVDYVEYVRQYADEQSLHKFDPKGGFFFFDSQLEEQRVSNT